MHIPTEEEIRQYKLKMEDWEKFKEIQNQWEKDYPGKSKGTLISLPNGIPKDIHTSFTIKINDTPIARFMEYATKKYNHKEYMLVMGKIMGMTIFPDAEGIERNLIIER